MVFTSTGILVFAQREFIAGAESQEWFMFVNVLFSIEFDAANDVIGKIVKMSGMFVAYTNQDQSQFYPAVIIADATACCSQGLEFVLEGNPSYPEGYPEMGTEITVVGIFET